MRIVLAVLAVAGLAATGAEAQTRTAQFAVRAQVVAECQITAQDLNFGAYTSSAATRASTALNLQCTPGSGATVSLDGGSSGDPRNRQMQGPDELNYQLYRDAALQRPLNSNLPAFYLSSRENDGQTVVYTVYGEVPSGQAVPAGNYVDTIRVTVNY